MRAWTSEPVKDARSHQAMCRRASRPASTSVARRGPCRGRGVKGSARRTASSQTPGAEGDDACSAGSEHGQRLVRRRLLPERARVFRRAGCLARRRHRGTHRHRHSAPATRRPRASACSRSRSSREAASSSVTGQPRLSGAVTLSPRMRRSSATVMASATLSASRVTYTASMPSALNAALCMTGDAECSGPSRHRKDLRGRSNITNAECP